MPVLLDMDCTKERILKEFIEGKTIMELVEKAEMKQISNLLYGHHLNIEYYPTNIIVKDDMLVYIDYECNKYSEQ